MVRRAAQVQRATPDASDASCGRAGAGRGAIDSTRRAHRRALFAVILEPESVAPLMANIASQIKRNRQNERARVRNKAARSAIKTAMKRFEAAVDAGDTDAAQAAYTAAASRLDRAARQRIVHPNFAANHKSKMARRLRS
jgi:small subunit ribosomal protein S20